MTTQTGRNRPRGPMTDEHKKKVGDGVAKGRRKPVSLTPVPGVAGYVYVLWTDGEVETREVTQ